jgi:hypothetical protein
MPSFVRFRSTCATIVRARVTSVQETCRLTLHCIPSRAAKVWHRYRLSRFAPVSRPFSSPARGADPRCADSLERLRRSHVSSQARHALCSFTSQRRTLKTRGQSIRRAVAGRGTRFSRQRRWRRGAAWLADASTRCASRAPCPCCWMGWMTPSWRRMQRGPFGSLESAPVAESSGSPTRETLPSS